MWDPPRAEQVQGSAWFTCKNSIVALQLEGAKAEREGRREQRGPRAVAGIQDFLLSDGTSVEVWGQESDIPFGTAHTSRRHNTASRRGQTLGQAQRLRQLGGRMAMAAAGCCRWTRARPLPGLSHEAGVCKAASQEWRMGHGSWSPVPSSRKVSFCSQLCGAACSYQSGRPD